MVRKKTDPFWRYVVDLGNGRWKCGFCSNEYSGHVSRVKAHLGNVKNRGIDICDKVDETVKEGALRALHKEAPDTKQRVAEETTQWIDQGIGFENGPFVDPSSNYDFLQHYQSGYNYSHYSAGEPSHPVAAENLSVPFENNEQDTAILHAQVQQVDPLPHSSFQQQNEVKNEVNTVIGTANSLQFQNINEVGVNENSVSVCAELDQKLLTLKRKLKCLSNLKEEKEEELHQWSKKVKTTKRLYQKIKEVRSEGNHSSLDQLNQVKELISQVEELANSDRSEKETSRIVTSPKAPPLLTKLIGRDSEKSKIWNSLVSDGILRVGVYGMGGVGKTEIMMNIYNKLLIDEAFDNVFWVTIPEVFSVYELQGVIGNAVHLDELSNEKNDKIRAAMLNRFLTSGKKYVMILDGLWRYFNYYDVGIPLTYDGLKLVITCRSLNVLQMMFCQEKITIKPLAAECWKSFAWELFLDELGMESELPKEVRGILRDIVRACNGLPLLIKAVATRMRGVKNVEKWSDMMKKMNDFKEKFYELNGLVLDQLKLSYELLNSHELRQCLIFCAFYYKVRANASIREIEEFLVDIGLIDGSKSRKEMLNRVRSNLEELENACLLTLDKIRGTIEMHVAITDMVLHVATNANLFKVDIGIGSLHEEFQIENLSRLSLMRDTKDHEISKPSSKGIRLPIVITEEYENLEATSDSEISDTASDLGILDKSLDPEFSDMIPDSVFIVFSELKILNLSGSRIKKLPNSFSDLIRLTALILQRCCWLHHIPNMEKLTSLRKLDLYQCENVIALPNGVENLVNLEYLDVSDTGILELRGGALKTLKKLQCLIANFVGTRELGGLAKLERLGCTFKDLTIFLDFFSERRRCVAEYFIHVGTTDGGMPFPINKCFQKDDRAIKFGNITDMRRDIFLPKNFSDCLELKNLEDLEIHGCKKFMVIFGEAEDERYVTSNDGTSQIALALNIRRIKICGCEEFKYLIGPGAETRYYFPALREIVITDCRQFQRMTADPLVLPRLGHAAFPCLESINISGSVEFKYLIGPGAETRYYFPALQEIRITRCSLFQRITADPLVLPPLAHAAFPCLESINISGSVEFKYLIGPGAETRYYFPALRDIVITDCRQFQRITADPLVLPQLAHAAFPCLESINISSCHEFKYLIGPGAETRYYFPALREITISCCCQFQRITADPLVLPRLTHAAFPCLESIHISSCDELEEIIAISSSEMPHSTSTLAGTPTHFPHLTSLVIRWCRKMKRLLNHDILPYLSNLQHIEVFYCCEMEELTSTYNEHTGDLCPVICLPNLKKLELTSLAELRCIGAIALTCPIETIKVRDCPKIKRIPLQMEELSNGATTTPSPPSSLKDIVINEYEKDWWESLEWESLAVKNALQPYLRKVKW